ncbi:MAG: putative signal peptide peptidase SppA [Alphaproteobacteria bacterium MarineAlpha5_Bin9]|nr:MAG: putative signal peptide peptidase SppA [Alphaproteobacteria bacterium MarineAlpha5_Bin9]|tara:strand:+ start:1529 stop:2584 length:1056 start_codon:yes stop_codon:yes gene_type:complete
MRVFLDFFLKTFAFLSSIFLFFFLILTIFSWINEENLILNQNLKFIEGDKDSKNTILKIKLKGPILLESSYQSEFNLIGIPSAIYVNELEKIFDNLIFDEIKGMVISIDSPGGTVSATYKFYNILEKLKKKYNLKIYFYSNEILTSGAYWTALAGDKIYTNYGTIIGSIGVRGPDWIYYNKPIAISNSIFDKSVETIDGIKKYRMIAGKSKDIYDSFRKPTDKEISALQEILDEVYLDFVNLVSKKRKIENDFIENEIGALIYNAKKAKKIFLIDDIKELKDVYKLMIRDLNLENYKILKLTNQKSLYENFIKTSYYLAGNSLEKDINIICKEIDNFHNIFLINNFYINKC